MDPYESFMEGQLSLNQGCSINYRSPRKSNRKIKQITSERS